MAKVFCKVTNGLRPAEATVEVPTYAGRSEFMPVDRGLLSETHGKAFLSVVVLHVNWAKKAALVSLPVEADSGVNRIWVKLADLQNYEGVAGDPLGPGDPGGH